MEQVQLRNVTEVARLLGVPGDRLAFSHSLVAHTSDFPVVDPGLDAYLARMAVCWSHGCSDATVVTTPLLPGALDEHYRPLGFTPRLVEVARPHAGLRHGDPLGYLAMGGAPVNGVHLPERPVLLASFVTPHVESLGQTVLRHQACVTANSKVAMREAAARYGFRVFPGMVVSSVGECQTATRAFRFPLWLKADGSGSDFVIKVNTPAAMELAVRTMIGRLLQGWATLPSEFHSRQLQVLIKRWTERLADPTPLPRGWLLPQSMVIEQDARTLGRLIGNICWQGVVTDGEPMYIGHSDQIISPDGAEWWGSKSSELKLSAATTDGARRICRWFQSLGYRGCVGPDAMLVEQDDGRVVAYWIDPNARPAMSTTAFVVHNALMGGEGGWINTNLTLPRPIECFADLREQMGAALLAPGGEDDVQAVLLASRSETGDPSSVVKMLFLSRLGRGACEQAIQRLVAERGIVRGS